MSEANAGQPFQIDMTPDPPMMEGLAQTRLGFGPALAEFLDNSFDHGAQRVAINFKGKTVTIRDDGEGLDNLETLFKYGKHVAVRAQTLGRYGVGFKDAAAYIGGTTHVTTVRKGQIQSLRLRLTKLDSWQRTAYRLEATPNNCRDCEVDAPSGLTIQCIDYQRKAPDLDKLRADLAFTFGPGIRQGRQILIGHNDRLKPLVAWPFPELEESFTQSDEINGRSYTLTAGVVRQGTPNQKAGFTIAYLHRVILTTHDPCGHYGPAHFFAYVELGPGWRLSTHKDALADDQYDELVERLAVVCEPLLARAQARAHDVSLHDLENSLTQLAGQLVKPGKEKRREANGVGTHSAPGTHPPKKSATNLNPGNKPLRTPSATNGIKIQFVEDGAEAGPAKVRLYTHHKRDEADQVDFVLLNRDHAFIERCRQRHDEVALVITALSNYALELATATEEQRQRRLPFLESGDSVRSIYTQTLDRWLSQLGHEGGERLLVAV